MAERLRLVGVLIVAVVLATPIPALGKTEVEWTASEPLSGTVEGDELLVTAESHDMYPLVVIEDPGVEPPRFQVDGTVRYEDVDGHAYFEMWTVLADESRYFTRTLAESGPMGVMNGDSDSRPFSLPFELGEGGPVPTRLEINLVTEGPGRFWVGPLTVLSAVETATTATTPTTTPTTQAPTSTMVGPVVTTIPTDQEDGGDSGLWWGLGALVIVGGAGLGWLRFNRKRRAEEQRRMNAMDSLRS